MSVVLLLKSTLQGVTDTPLVQVMGESNDSAHIATLAQTLVLSRGLAQTLGPLSRSRLKGFRRTDNNINTSKTRARSPRQP
jgi:hypothetical protein